MILWHLLVSKAKKYFWDQQKCHNSKTAHFSISSPFVKNVLYWFQILKFKRRTFLQSVGQHSPWVQCVPGARCLMPVSGCRVPVDCSPSLARWRPVLAPAQEVPPQLLLNTFHLTTSLAALYGTTFLRDVLILRKLFVVCFFIRLN